MSTNWSGKHVLVIGAARQGLAVSRYLVDHGARVTLNDRKPESELAGIRSALGDRKVELVLGEHHFSLLDGTDLVCVSGGVPLTLEIITEADGRGIPTTNDSQLFLAAVPCPVIGITGSAGKTTTTTVVGRMAQVAVERKLVPHPHAWVGGNIGNPLIDQIDSIDRQDLVILELSSFQLELMTIAPHLAAILNITPNHLDRHSSMAAYTAAKQRILDYQNAQDLAILNREDPGAFELRSKVRGELVTFGLNPSDLPGTWLDGELITMNHQGKSHPLFPRTAIELRGQHNLLNVLAAAAIAWSSGIPAEAMAAALKGFTGAPHRLEFVRTFNGARWYNDSIATAPERTSADIHSFEEPLVLLLGGRDKNLPWQELADLVCKRVTHAVLFGEAAPKIEAALKAARSGGHSCAITTCTGLEDAVTAAASLARAGDVVLLAPGCTSFDQFRDFEERGEKFKLWVNKLT